MDFDLTPEQQAYREQVRRWVAEHLPRAPRRSSLHRHEPPERVRERYAAWQRMRHQGGVTCVMWPEAYGGAGKGVVEHYIVSREVDTLDVVPPINVVGFGICLPTVLHAGTEAQKQRWLPPAARGEHVWCQLFSEPGAGSDLAGVQTRAEPDGEGWRLHGQKVWTSFAHHADYGLCLARTDPAAPRHRGLTMFVVDMRRPGVTVRPIPFSSGDHDFNEVFLDGVRVEPDEVLGRPGSGWEVAIGALMTERGTSNIHVLFRPWLDKALDHCRHRLAGAEPTLAVQQQRARLARVLTHLRIMDLHGLRTLYAAAEGGTPGPEGSFVKLLWSETSQELARLAVDILGPAGTLLDGDEGVPEHGWYPRYWLRSFGHTLEAGSSEVLRNIVAERILGLPKDAARAGADPPPPARRSGAAR